MNKNDLGIFCKKDKTFYYLETGPMHIKNHLPRIKKTLMQRSLIEMDPETQTDSQTYDIIKMSEAIDKEYKVVPIYLNPHIKNLNKSTDKEENGKWK